MSFAGGLDGCICVVCVELRAVLTRAVVHCPWHCPVAACLLVNMQALLCCTAGGVQGPSRERDSQVSRPSVDTQYLIWEVSCRAVQCALQLCMERTCAVSYYSMRYQWLSDNVAHPVTSSLTSALHAPEALLRCLTEPSPILLLCPGLGSLLWA